MISILDEIPGLISHPRTGRIPLLCHLVNKASGGHRKRGKKTRPVASNAAIGYQSIKTKINHPSLSTAGTTPA